MLAVKSCRGFKLISKVSVHGLKASYMWTTLVSVSRSTKLDIRTRTLYFSNYCLLSLGEKRKLKMIKVAFAVLFLSLTMFLLPVTCACPEGWITSGDSCYKTSPDALTWYQAEEVIWFYAQGCNYFKTWLCATPKMKTTVLANVFPFFN